MTKEFDFHPNLDCWFKLGKGTLVEIAQSLPLLFEARVNTENIRDFDGSTIIGQLSSNEILPS